MFASKPFSGATKAGVNFVEDEQRAEFITKFSKQRKKFLRRNIDAAARLNRFNENRANFCMTKIISHHTLGFAQVGFGFWKWREVAKLSKLRAK